MSSLYLHGDFSAERVFTTTAAVAGRMSGGHDIGNELAGEGEDLVRVPPRG